MPDESYYRTDHDHNHILLLFCLGYGHRWNPNKDDCAIPELNPVPNFQRSFGLWIGTIIKVKEQSVLGKNLNFNLVLDVL